VNDRRGEGPEDDAARRRLFRRMSWTYVYGPPLVLILVALAGGALVGLILPVPWPFWQRWLVVVAIAIGAPLLGLGVRRLLR